MISRLQSRRATIHKPNDTARKTEKSASAAVDVRGTSPIRFIPVRFKTIPVKAAPIALAESWTVVIDAEANSASSREAMRSTCVMM